jgi:hypothetical protein
MRTEEPRQRAGEEAKDDRAPGAPTVGMVASALMVRIN